MKPILISLIFVLLIQSAIAEKNYGDGYSCLIRKDTKYSHCIDTKVAGAKARKWDKIEPSQEVVWRINHSKIVVKEFWIHTNDVEYSDVDITIRSLKEKPARSSIPKEYEVIQYFQIQAKNFNFSYNQVLLLIDVNDSDARLIFHAHNGSEWILYPYGFYNLGKIEINQTGYFAVSKIKPISSKKPILVKTDLGKLANELAETNNIILRIAKQSH